MMGTIGRYADLVQGGGTDVVFEEDKAVALLDLIERWVGLDAKQSAPEQRAPK